MTKIAFIGAGSLGFARKLARDIFTFPLLRDAEIALMDIDAERLDFSYRADQAHRRTRQLSAKITATLDRVDALRDADAGPRDNSRRGGTGRMAARHRNPEAIWRGYQRRRYRADRREFFRGASHDSSDARHRARHGACLPQRSDAQLHQSDGDALPRAATRDLDPRDRLVPQRARHRGKCLHVGSAHRWREITYTCAGQSTTSRGI